MSLAFKSIQAEIGVDDRQYSGPAWSPYRVGTSLGILSWLTLAGLILGLGRFTVP
jgi:hypothetical protein